jgi:probable HAF family extracellular repeat protein
MLMRNRNTGAFEVFDISNNAVVSSASMGQVGLEWQVAGIPVPPFLFGGGNSVNYTPQGAAVTVGAGIGITDSSSATLAGATVAISAGLLAGDILNFTNQNGIAGSYNASTGVLTLSGSASLADYQAALESITYSSTSGNPSDSGADPSRMVSWAVTDGTLSSNIITSTIAATYSFSTISDPNAGSEGTIITGVNASGELAGDYYDSGGAEHGFTYGNGSFTDFSDLPGAPPTYENHIGIVAGINDSGWVAGYYSIDIPFGSYGFIDNNGSYSYFGISPYTENLPPSGVVTAINSTGEVVGNIGSYITGFGFGRTYVPPSGFIYVSGTFTSISEFGGSPATNPNYNVGTFAETINASGEVAGYYKDSNGVPHGFTYSGGTFTNFSDRNAGSGGTIVTGINDSGQVVGDYYDSSGVEHGFVADPSDPPALSGGGNSVNYTAPGAVVATDAGLGVSDGSNAASGSSAASAALLVQAMASFGASVSINSAAGAIPGIAEAPQQTLLALAPHQR